jgi:tRNA dimethylallyltransferase
VSKQTLQQAQSKKIIAIVGPTASGKSALGVYLAQKLGGLPAGRQCEILSADSRQVYKGLDIGTGKVTKREMQGIPHHLLSIVSPKRQFSADDFVRLGECTCSSILQKARIPVVVGGTGFYVDALLGRVSLPNVPPNPALRARLEKKSVEELFTRLKKLDPTRAKTIEPHHKRRLIRAIEIGRSKKNSEGGSAGRRPEDQSKFSAENLRTPEESFFEQPVTLWLGLSPTPTKLKKKIHARLNERMRRGMVAEAKRLHKHGLSYKRMEELGLEYRYLARLLQDKISKKEFEEVLEREINHYAKRQMRWFKRNPKVRWVKNRSEALRLAKAFLSR